MSFVLGMVAGSLISFVVLVAFMAPKHWETYHENVDLKASLRNALSERDHYKNLVKPNLWGPVEEHEARIVRQAPAYEAFMEEASKGDVEFKFDDIRETP